VIHDEHVYVGLVLPIADIASDVGIVATTWNIMLVGVFAMCAADQF